MKLSKEDLQKVIKKAKDIIEIQVQCTTDIKKRIEVNANLNTVSRGLTALKTTAQILDSKLLGNHVASMEKLLESLQSQTLLAETLVETVRVGLVNAQHILSQQSYREASEKIQSSPRKRKVLIVDDEQSIVDLLIDILEQEDLIVRGITASSNVIREIKEFGPDIILSDMSMPEIDGMQLLSMVKAADQSLPVILISGVVNDKMREQARNLGAFDIVEKPFDIAQVIDLAKRALEKRRHSQALASMTLKEYKFS